jgi:signal transduction histidine kinase
MEVIPRPVSAPVPTDEAARLQDLYAYEILDSDPEEPFDDLVQLASQICGTPWAVVNFIDEQRQWTKAVRGLDGGDTPREVAFCPHTIVAPGGFLLVEDTHADERFAQNPLVVDDPSIRFYAGSAIHSASGRPIGTVCVVDSRPRSLSREQEDALRLLSRLATTQLELRRLLTGERKLVDDLRELDRQKAEFTAVVAHDFRSPLTSIRGYAELVREDAVPQETALDAIERNSDRLLRLVDDLTGSPAELDLQALDVADAARAAAEVARPVAQAGDVRLELDLRPAPVRADAARLAQILDNLVGNAVKYSPHGVVRISTRAHDRSAVLEVADTGVGIPEAELPRLFDRFFRASTSASFHGTGIGLSTVKALVAAHGGTIDVTSRVGAGTTFRVELPLRRA